VISDWSEVSGGQVEVHDQFASEHSPGSYRLVRQGASRAVGHSSEERYKAAMAAPASNVSYSWKRVEP
jgi:hypothetical protein